MAGSWRDRGCANRLRPRTRFTPFQRRGPRWTKLMRHFDRVTPLMPKLGGLKFGSGQAARAESRKRVRDRLIIPARAGFAVSVSLHIFYEPRRESLVGPLAWRRAVRSVLPPE